MGDDHFQNLCGESVRMSVHRAHAWSPGRANETLGPVLDDATNHLYGYDTSTTERGTWNEG